MIEAGAPYQSAASATPAAATLLPPGADKIPLPPSATASAAGSYPPLSQLDRFPRGLAGSVEEVLFESRAESAMALAELLAECRSVSRDMAALREGMASVRDADMQRRLSASYLAMQSYAGQCEAVGGNLTDLRHRLLALARDKVVAGAAAQLYLERVRDARTIAAVVADAHRGDLSSMALLAHSQPAAVGIDAAQQNYIRLALVEAARDPRTAEFARGYLEVAERLYTATINAAGRSGYEINKSEVSRLPVQVTDSAKIEAQRIVEKVLILKKMTNPTQG